MIPAVNLVIPVENLMAHGPKHTGSEDVVTRQGISRPSRHLLLGSVCAALLILGLATLFSANNFLASRPIPSGRAAAASPAVETRLGAYGKLPLRFEANRGQVRGAGSERVKFLARGRGYTLFVAPDEAVVALGSPRSEVRGPKSEARSQEPGVRSQKAGPRIPSPESRVTDNGARTTDVVRLKLVGANPQARVAGQEELPGKSNYFVGRDPGRWRTGVPNYRRVKVAGVYPGTNLVYYGQQGELEYDWVVEPGADARAIELQIETGISGPAEQRSEISNASRSAKREGVRLAANGDLVIATAAGEVRLRKPVVYQETSEVRGPKSEVGDGRIGVRSQGPVSRTVNGSSSIGHRKFLDGRYVLTAGNRVRLDIPNYDRSKPLIIDPVLS
jgi:hypothetical protein